MIWQNCITLITIHHMWKKNQVQQKLSCTSNTFLRQTTSTSHLFHHHWNSLNESTIEPFWALTARDRILNCYISKTKIIMVYSFSFIAKPECHKYWMMGHKSCPFHTIISYWEMCSAYQTNSLSGSHCYAIAGKDTWTCTVVYFHF